MIATNTVAQGDSREVGLDAMVADGFTITRAIRSRAWPAATANLEYAAVWGTPRVLPSALPRFADGVAVRSVSALLEAAHHAEPLPKRLAQNAGMSFQGCIVLGRGFVLTPHEAQQWIAADARNAEVLFPYLNGEDLNSRPDSSPSRWVIDFDDRTEEEASTYSQPFERVRSRVKPERDKLRGRNTTADDRAKNWWKYGRRGSAMRRAIAPLSQVLVIARVSKTVMPLRVGTGGVPSEACVVFASDSYALQAVLSSSFHQIWALTYGSTLETRVRYTPSDVFETYPLPVDLPEPLTTVGKSLDDGRREIMLQRGLGLTKLYNLVYDEGVRRDPDVDHMREMHRELDEVVKYAYDWHSLSLNHGFFEVRGLRRWTIDETARRESLERLLHINNARA